MRMCREIAARLYRDEQAFIVSAELVLIATVAVIGLIVGMVAIRDAVVSELSDVAGAMQDLNQSYSYNRVTGHSGWTYGSSWTDRTDWCDVPEDVSNVAENCITFTTGPTNES